MPREINNSIIINAPIDKVFDALISPSKIKKWWFAKTAIILPEIGGCYDVLWGENEDDPDYITTSTILDIQKPKMLRLAYGKYYSKSGELPFEADFEVSFMLKEKEEAVELTVIQAGFPDESYADPYLQGCIKGWDDTCNSLKSVIE